MTLRSGLRNSPDDAGSRDNPRILVAVVRRRDNTAERHQSACGIIVTCLSAPRRKDDRGRYKCDFGNYPRWASATPACPRVNGGNPTVCPRWRTERSDCSHCGHGPSSGRSPRSLTIVAGGCFAIHPVSRSPGYSCSYTWQSSARRFRLLMVVRRRRSSRVLNLTHHPGASNFSRFCLHTATSVAEQQ